MDDDATMLPRSSCECIVESRSALNLRSPLEIEEQKATSSRPKRSGVERPLYFLPDLADLYL